MEAGAKEDITPDPSKENSDKPTGDARKADKRKANAHPRKRKRHHFNGIREQMEFYFGDANLTKSRFLRQLIEKDQYVPLEVFLTFNKMKLLTASTEEIAKSLSNSELLELDDQQQKVRRKTEIPIERNVDEKTIYVEALPPKADHDWVRRLFERFGAVTYVSLPKYTKSHRIKEFGFIEFAKESSVSKAIKEFESFNGVLSTQETDPAELTSVKSFVKEQAENAETGNDSAAPKKAKKRVKDEGVVEVLPSKDTMEGGPEPKRLKINTPKKETTEEAAANIKEQSAASNAEDSKNNTADSAAVETGENTDADNADPETATTKKKRRKKKHSVKAAEKGKHDPDLSLDSAYYELKILPKRDWKRLRNKYLNLQRERMSELKRQAWKERQLQQQQQIESQQTAEQLAGKENSDEAEVAATAAAPPPAKKSRQSERRLQKMSMNFYGAAEEEASQPKATPQPAKETKRNPALERAPLFSYSPGLIVEVGMLQPCVNVKEFKADMRQYTAVKYIDIKEGAMHAHLRLESPTAAEQFVGQVGCAEYACRLLTGDAEADYWHKIEQDREMKLNKQVKVPHKRGREKMQKLTAKHTRFGDADEEE